MVFNLGTSAFYNIIYSGEFGKLIFCMWGDKVDNIEIKSAIFDDVEDEVLKANEAFIFVDIRYYAKGKFMVCIHMDGNSVDTEAFPIEAPDIIKSVASMLDNYNLNDYQYYVSVVDGNNKIILHCAWPAGDDSSIYRIEYYEDGKRDFDKTRLFRFTR